MTSDDSGTMDRLINQQVEQQGLIMGFWENVLKMGRDKLTAQYVRSRVELLDKYWDRFTSVHMQILAYKGARKTDYYEQFVKTEDSYVTIRAKLQDLLAPSIAKSGGAAAAAPPPNEPSTLALMQQMLLPKTELPKFSGAQRDWEGFKDLYVSLVHDVKGISSSQKLQLLRGSLTGEAARCIAGCETNDAGYHAAWESLVAFYDAKRDIQTFHILALIRLPVMTKPSAQGIKQMICSLKQAVRAFESLKRPVEH